MNMSFIPYIFIVIIVIYQFSILLHNYDVNILLNVPVNRKKLFNRTSDFSSYYTKTGRNTFMQYEIIILPSINLIFFYYFCNDHYYTIYFIIYIERHRVVVSIAIFSVLINCCFITFLLIKF